MASKSRLFLSRLEGLQQVWAAKLGSHDPRILAQVFVSIERYQYAI
jgi:hypothetical protein